MVSTRTILCPNTNDPLSYADRLKEAMQSVQYQPTHMKSQQSTFVHKELLNCTHVFVRWDAWRPLLQPTHDGPFRVIDRKERYFVVALNDSRQDTISIDRLKPAYFIHIPESLTEHSSNRFHQHLTCHLIIIPHNRHLQLFVPGLDVGFSYLTVSFKHFNPYYVYSFIMHSLEGELFSVSLLH